MLSPSRIAQDEGVISDSKLAGFIEWLQGLFDGFPEFSIPDFVSGLFDQNPWLVGGVSAAAIMWFLFRMGRSRK